MESTTPLANIRPYCHCAHYYETDQMGVVHHSNYIRWMEEARVDYMNQMGFSYRRMEECGIISPVLGVECTYKSMVHFDETVQIDVTVKEYTGTRLTIGYRMTDPATKALRTVGTSRHCFLNREGRAISLKRSYPDIHALFQRYLVPEYPNDLHKK